MLLQLELEGLRTGDAIVIVQESGTLEGAGNLEEELDLGTQWLELSGESWNSGEINGKLGESRGFPGGTRSTERTGSRI